MDLYPRPSHADWSYLLKYGVKASSGGGRSSARETIGRVAAGAIAEKYLWLAYGVEIVAFVSSVGKVHIPYLAAPSNDKGDEDADDVEEHLTEEYMHLLDTVTRADVDATLVRCPHAETAAKMDARIRRAKAANDSIGGTVTCVIRNVPEGLGEPCFDKLEAKLAHAMLSIPATKGFEIGSGFRGAEVAGSRHNDAFVRRPDGKLGTATNRSGGVQGGISNGEHIFFRVAFKSAATISQAQKTATYDGKEGVLEAKGRHDPSVVSRAVPVVESMASLCLLECVEPCRDRTDSRSAVMIQAARQQTASLLPSSQSDAMPAACKRPIPRPAPVNGA